MIKIEHSDGSDYYFSAVYLASSLNHLLINSNCTNHKDFTILIHKLKEKFSEGIKFLKTFTLPPYIDLHQTQPQFLSSHAKGPTRLFSKVGSTQLDSTNVDLLAFYTHESDSITKQDLDSIYYLSVLSHSHIQKILGISFVDYPLIIKQCFEDTLRKWRVKKKFAKTKHLKEYLGLLDAARYLHLKNLVHNKINPHTVVVNIQNKFALSGFEKCSIPNSTDQLLDAQVGYMAPEKVLYQHVGLEGDIWSLGCVLFYLLKCEEPFPGVTDRDSYINVVVYRKTQPSLDEKNPFYTFVKKMLKLRPDKRITAGEAFEEFEAILIKYYPDF